jgi:hypothetical protein
MGGIKKYLSTGAIKNEFRGYPVAKTGKWALCRHELTHTRAGNVVRAPKTQRYNLLRFLHGTSSAE